MYAKAPNISRFIARLFARSDLSGCLKKLPRQEYTNLFRWWPHTQCEKASSARGVKRLSKRPQNNRAEPSFRDSIMLFFLIRRSSKLRHLSAKRFLRQVPSATT